MGELLPEEPSTRHAMHDPVPQRGWDTHHVEQPGVAQYMPHSEDFVSRVLAVVESIPPGRVMTYGDVAAALGSRAARAVGQVMAYYGSDVPWWRVIRASGQPPLCHDDEALPRYETEGTPLVRTPSRYRIDLRVARYRP